MVWALLMCLANQIAAHFAPDKLAFVRDVFVVLIFPMVLFPIRNKRPGDSPVGGSGTSPMPKIGIEKPVKLLWVEGNCLWCSMVPLLWWRAYEAQTAAQASLNITRLGVVSGIGAVWSVAGAVWLTKLRVAAKLTSQIGPDGVIPLRQYFAELEVE